LTELSIRLLSLPIHLTELSILLLLQNINFNKQFYFGVYHRLIRAELKYQIENKTRLLTSDL